LVATEIPTFHVPLAAFFRLSNSQAFALEPNGSSLPLGSSVATNLPVFQTGILLQNT